MVEHFFNAIANRIFYGVTQAERPNRENKLPPKGKGINWKAGLLVSFSIFHKSFEIIKIRKTELKDKIRDSVLTIQIIIFLIGIGYFLYGLPDFIQTKDNENYLLIQASTMLLLFFLVFLFVSTLCISTLHFKFREQLVTLTFNFLFVILAFFLVTISENRMS